MNQAEAHLSGFMHSRGMVNGGGPAPPNQGGPPDSGQGGASVMPMSNGAHLRICAGCGHKIVERFLLHAADLYWHTTCLKCYSCSATLADIGSSCFTKGGLILCRTDYLRMYGNTGACTVCGQTIPASEMVMRAHGGVYHLKCFACAKCHHQLMPGDRYNVVNGSLLCEQDCHKFLKGAIATGPATTGRKAKISRQEARQNKMAKAAAMCQGMDLNQGAFI